MIGKFAKIEFYFSKKVMNGDGSFNRYDTHTRVAETPEEREKILEEYSSVLHWEGYRMKRSSFVKCSCGSLVECDRFTNTCGCGKDYGPDGSLLADRSQWGEETGESWVDLIGL